MEGPLTYKCVPDTEKKKNLFVCVLVLFILVSNGFKTLMTFSRKVA